MFRWSCGAKKSAPVQGHSGHQGLGLGGLIHENQGQREGFGACHNLGQATPTNVAMTTTKHPAAIGKCSQEQPSSVTRKGQSQAKHVGEPLGAYWPAWHAEQELCFSTGTWLESPGLLLRN